MRRATVVLPVPGLPVSIVLRQFEPRIVDGPPLSTKRIFPRISSNHFFTPPSPTRPSISASMAARCASFAVFSA